MLEVIIRSMNAVISGAVGVLFNKINLLIVVVVLGPEPRSFAR
jgi:hypothetical protein